MQLKDKIPLLITIRNYFLRPLCASTFLVFTLLALIKPNLANTYVYLATILGLIILLDFLYLRFKHLLLHKETQRFIKNILFSGVLIVIVLPTYIQIPPAQLLTLHIILIVFGLYAFIFSNETTSYDEPKFSSKKSALLLILLIFTALVIRLYNLGDLSLWWDEIITGTYVSRIIETGMTISPSGYENYWRGIPYHYVTAFFASFFGEEEFWLRFPGVLFGIGTIIASYFSSYKINKYIAIAVAAVLVFSTYNIEYSRFARFYILNSFLFMLSFELFWKGFIVGNTKFKILCFLIFILMLATSQLGGIFVSFIIYLIFHKIYFVYINKLSFKTLLTKENIVTLTLFLSLYLIGNPFDLLGDYRDMPYEITSIGTVEGNVSYIIPGIPYPELNNILLPFFNQYYWTAILPVLAFFYIGIALLKKIRSRIKFGFTEYFFCVSLITYVLFEFANPYRGEPRLYLIFEPIYVISSLYILYILINYLYSNRLFKRTLFTAITLFLITVPSPNFIDRINIAYGDDVSTDPFRTTWAQKYRTDSESIYKYLDNNISEGDIWINTLEPVYTYTKLTPDYIVNQNYKWKNMWREEIFTDRDGNFIDIRYDSVLLNTVEEIDYVIDKHTKTGNVWLVVKGQNLETLYTVQLNNSFYKFLEDNQANTVHFSPDKLSRVLLFPAE